MNLEREPRWYNIDILSKSVNIKNIAIFSMLVIYPLVVIPNNLGYFYFPRYVMFCFISILCLFNLIKEEKMRFLFIYILLALYLLFITISSIVAKNNLTAWLGLFGIQGILVEGKNNSISLVSTARFTGFATILCCVVMFLTAYKVEKQNWLINGMIICAAIVGFISLLQYLGINIVPHEASRDTMTAYGTIGNSNFLATYTAFILPASVYKFIKSNGCLWLISSALVFAGLLVSTTRGVWMASAITFLFMALYFMKRKEYRKGFVISLISFLIVIAILLPVKDWFIYKRALSIPTNVSSALQMEGEAGSGRMYIWKETLKLIPQNWAFGVGPDNLIYSGISLNGAAVDKAHNIYLETAVTMGIPALVFYLAFLSFFIFRRWRTDKDFMFFSMISTYLIQGFFNIDVIMVLPLFWIVLGLYQGNMEEEKLITANTNV